MAFTGWKMAFASKQGTLNAMTHLSKNGIKLRESGPRRRGEGREVCLASRAIPTVPVLVLFYS